MIVFYVFARVYAFLLWEHFRCQQRKWWMRVLEACRCSTVCLIKVYTWKQYEPRLRSLCTTSPARQSYCRRLPSSQLCGAAASAFVWVKCTQMLTPQCKHDSTGGQESSQGGWCARLQLLWFRLTENRRRLSQRQTNLFTPGNYCSHSAAPLDWCFVVCVAQKKKKTSS